MGPLVVAEVAVVDAIVDEARHEMVVHETAVAVAVRWPVEGVGSSTTHLVVNNSAMTETGQRDEHESTHHHSSYHTSPTGS